MATTAVAGTTVRVLVDLDKAVAARLDEDARLCHCTPAQLIADLLRQQYELDELDLAWAGRATPNPDAATEERDPDQAWFWTPEWQEGMARARQEVAEGKTIGPFTDVDELIAALRMEPPDD